MNSEALTANCTAIWGVEPKTSKAKQSVPRNEPAFREDEAATMFLMWTITLRSDDPLHCATTVFRGGENNNEKSNHVLNMRFAVGAANGRYGTR